ncbi:transcription elongation factor B polypeptide 2-like protein [Cricetulus griseus]|nr:transcription elongation factor B polypeptide 2-like protein [Cricetulus griseus]
MFLMIRRHKTTIFTDAKESSTVFEHPKLWAREASLAKQQGRTGPATVGLAFLAGDAFEDLRIEPFSSPPELPRVMKPQDSACSAHEQAVQ